jgi:hypothetical protein
VRKHTATGVRGHEKSGWAVWFLRAGGHQFLMTANLELTGRAPGVPEFYIEPIAIPARAEAWPPPAGRRAPTRPGELLSLAAIPHSAYVVDGEVPGAILSAS